jgi:hypothetical protein
VSTQYIEEEGDFHSIGKHQLSHHFKTPLVSILTKESWLRSDLIEWIKIEKMMYKVRIAIKGIYKKTF